MIKKLLTEIKKKPIHILLVCLPAALFAESLGWSEISIFILTALAIVPLAGLIGDATEVLGEHTGPRLGGLLNATLGNAAELIITIFAIREGLLELVKASITGSILGNILLVLGMSFLLGGAKNGVQKFDRRHASRNSILLMLAVIAMVIPSLVSGSIGPVSSMRVESLSLGIAVIMIILYSAGLLYGFRNSENSPNEAHADILTGEISPARSKVQSKRKNQHTWSVKSALILLAFATIGVAYLSELLVGVVEPVTHRLGISEFFLGIILIPIIGNVAEHLVAVLVAINNKMDLSVEIAIASSLQIALFVAPLLVFISLIMGNPLQLIFNQFELLALVIGVLITATVAQDGESNWLEGAELIAVYLILSLAFFLLPI